MYVRCLHLLPEKVYTRLHVLCMDSYVGHHTNSNLQQVQWFTLDALILFTLSAGA